IQRSRPGAFQRDAIEGEVLFGGGTGVNVVDTHGTGLCGYSGREKWKQHEFHSGQVQHSWWSGRMGIDATGAYTTAADERRPPIATQSTSLLSLSLSRDPWSPNKPHSRGPPARGTR